LQPFVLFLVSISPAVCAQAEGPQKPPPAIPALIAKIDGADADNREEIAGSLAEIGAPSVEPLITALRDRSPKVRGVAARALELIGKKAERAVPALIACLADLEPPDDPMPKREPNPMFAGWGRAGEPDPSVYQRALAEIGEAAVAALVKQLDVPDLRARLDALRALAFVFDEKKAALPRLTALLDDPAVRFEAAKSLGGINPPARLAIPRLIAALKDPDPVFRALAAETIGRIGWARLAGKYSSETVARGAVAPLCESLADPDPKVRAAAAIALGDIGPEAGAAAPRIIRMFKDPDVEVRLAALRAVERNGTVSSDDAATVVRLLKDNDVRIRLAALAVIGESALQTDQVLNAVARALEDHDSQSKMRAMSLLSKAFEPRQSMRIISHSRIAGDALRRCLGESDDRLRKSAARLLSHFPSQAALTVPPLIDRLKDEDAGVREAAARSLGAFGSQARAAVPPLFLRLYDPGRNPSDRSTVAASAAASIMELDPQSTDQVIHRLRGQLNDPDENIAEVGVKILSALGSKGTSELWRVVSNPNTSRAVRATSLQMLASAHETREARPGPPTAPRDPNVADAVPVLRKLVRDNDPDMGQNASALLARILSGDDEIAEFYFAAIHVKNLNRRMSTFNLRDKLNPATIPFLLERLNDPDGEVRAELLLAVAKQARGLPVPTTDFDERYEPQPPSPEEREKLATALRVKVQAAQAILPLLNDSDPLVRWNAAALLGQLGVQAKQAVPALRNMVRTETAQVARSHRIIPLDPLQSNYSDVGRYAAPRATDEKDSLRLSAVGALGRFGALAAEALPELMAILRTEKNMRTRWFAACAIHRIGPAAEDAVPILIDMVKSEAVAERSEKDAEAGFSNNLFFPETNTAKPLKVAGLVALGGIGPGAKAAIPHLVQTLDDSDPTARAEAAFALGRIGTEDDQAIAKLVKLMRQDINECVADRSGHALAMMGAKAVLAMTENCKLGDPDIRIRFVKALGEAGSNAAGAVPDLARAAADPDEEVRTAAVEALGLVGKGPAAVAVIPILISALKDADRRVRANAVSGLTSIGPKTDRVIPALVTALGDPDVEVASDASSALLEIGPPAIPAIKALLADLDPALPVPVEYVVSNLIRLDPDVHPRGETRVQAEARVKEARSLVLTALNSPNERIRDWAADRLADLGESIVAELIAALGDRSSRMRSGAAQTLELIGSKAEPALDALRKSLKDPDASVRAAADSAIKEILKSAP
jgi:HEAT repeat protein